MVHRLGWGTMVEAVESIGAAVLKRLPVIGGLAIVENAREQTALVEGLSPEEIPAGESRLLEVAREYVPALPVEEMDVLVVRELGKNYSGTGMDTNVIGRLRLEGLPEPERDVDVKLMVVNNTLHLSRLWVSERLVGELREREGIEVVGESFTLRFSSEGQMVLE